MNELQVYASAQAAGMAIIASAAGLSDRDLASMGLSLAESQEIISLHATYFGKCSNSRKQEISRSTMHTLDSLKIIEKFARRVKDVNLAWDLRKELCFTAAHKIDFVARKRIAQWKKPRTIEPCVQRSFLAGGMASLRIVATAGEIQDVYGNIRGSNHGNGQISELSPKEQVLAFMSRFFSGTASRTQLVTNVIIPLDDGIKIMNNNAEDVVLRLTNGTTMTGNEFLQAKLEQVGWATLVEPSGQPIYAGRTRRLANEVQRVMTSAQNPSCAWDDSCNKPADECQVHHIVAFKHGGETNPENLCTLCSFHNGRNDDSPHAPPKNGRIERVNGKPTRVFGSTSPLPANGYPASDYQAGDYPASDYQAGDYPASDYQADDYPANGYQAGDYPAFHAH